MIGRCLGAGFLLLLSAAPLAAQKPTTPAAPAALRSAPLTNLRYDVTFDSASAARRTIKVGFAADVGGTGPVLDAGSVRDHQLRPLGLQLHPDRGR
jgi:hypothetical protein